MKAKMNFVGECTKVRFDFHGVQFPRNLLLAFLAVKEWPKCGFTLLWCSSCHCTSLIAETLRSKEVAISERYTL